MANTKVTGGVIADGAITAAKIASGALDGILNTYLTTNTYATQSYVTTAVNNLIDAAPASLDTLNELAAALNDDANFATTVTNSLATKLNLSGGTLTGALEIEGTGTLFKVNTATAREFFIDTTNPDHLKKNQNLVLHADPSNSHAGTNITFNIDNDEKARITSEGFLGLGTTSPGSPLHINKINGRTHITEFGHVSMQNKNASTTNYWGLAPRNDGTFNIAYGLVNADFNTNADDDILTITTGGNVGIGTSSPQQNVHVHNSGTGSQIQFTDSNSGSALNDGLRVGWNGTYGQVFLFENSYLRFGTNNSEAIRITSNGNVGIGTDNPFAKTHIKTGTSGFTGSLNTNYDDFAIEGSGNTGLTIITQNANNTGIAFGDEDNPNSGIILYAHSDDSLRSYVNGSERMRIQSDGNILIGTTIASTAKIKIDHSDNSPVISIESTNASYTATQFLINQTSSTAGQLARFRSQGVNRFIINGNGDVLINKTTFSNAGAGIMMRSASSDGGQIRLTRENNTNTQFHLLFYTNGGSGIGSISTTTSGTQFNISGSDLRLKKNIDDWSDSVLSDFTAIEPKLFHFNEQEDTEQKIKGYIAQDMVDKFPEAYPQNEEGYYNYNPSGMVVYLMKAVKELTAEIETLKSQINA